MIKNTEPLYAVLLDEDTGTIRMHRVVGWDSDKVGRSGQMEPMIVLDGSLFPAQRMRAFRGVFMPEEITPQRQVDWRGFRLVNNEEEA